MRVFQDMVRHDGWLAHPSAEYNSASFRGSKGSYSTGLTETQTSSSLSAVTPSKAAREICALCPVAEDCLNYALENHEEFGIWGNTTERERRQLRPAVAPRSHAAIVSRLAM
jgi:Transcription factor WhiB